MSDGVESGEDYTGLKPGEYIIGNGQEILRRQVHPSFSDAGQPSRQAFRPMSSDDGQLSTRREAMTAKEAWRQHVEVLGLKSIGTWGVAVQDVIECELQAVDDGALTGSPELHAYVDFRGLSNSKRDKIASRLKMAAIDRGCLYRPNNETAS